MQLKTFSSGSSAAVLAQIRSEFGAEAIILDTREEDGMVYMTAALERHPVTVVPARSDTEPVQERPSPRTYGLGGHGDETPARRASAPPPSKPAAKRAAKAAEDDDPLPTDSPGLRWEEEWRSIKSHILTLLQPSVRLETLSPKQRVAMELLQRQGVEEDVLLGLYATLKGDHRRNILTPLAEMLPVRPWTLEHWPQRTQIFAGPFGAGKSTVAIRVALSLRRASPGCPLCLINADAARGNGRLMLRHYCDLSEFVYKEAAGPLELAAALAAAKREGYERILVDMPGLARTRNMEHLLTDAGLGEDSGETADDAAVHLVMSPHYSGPELRGMLDRYRCPHAGSLVWTKLDEAEHYGQIVNAGYASGRPISAFSFGPGLGGTLSPARAQALWRLLFKKEMPK